VNGEPEQRIVEAADTLRQPITTVRSERAVATATALRTMARRAARIGVRRSWVAAATQERWSPFARGVLAGFIVCVLLPAIVAGIYYFGIASRQYVSEVRFAVRASGNAGNLLGGLGPFASSQRTEDALVIADYIRSRRLFEELDGELGLKRRYALPGADFLSRLDERDPIEDLVRYWRSKVDVKIDKNSGVVTVTARAFAADDALVIAQAIVARSEHLANELSERARRDAVRQSEGELQRAERGLQISIEDMRQTRNSQGVLDATKTAEAITKVITELRGRLLLLEGDYELQKPTVSVTAPQMKVLTSQIETLRRQIAALEQRIAGTQGPATLTDSQGQLERRAIERKIAEQQYALAVAEFERARLEQASKQVYLMVFVPPRLAEDALYPKRLLIWSLIVAAGIAIWGCSVGTAVLVRDHMAV